MITTPFTFPPILLLLNCFFISIYREWLGAYGTYFASIATCIFSLFLIISEVSIFYDGLSYSFLDFGRYFYSLDIIDSHFIFCLDSLSLFASALVIMLTAFALTFGLEYMYREAFVTRLIYLLNLFATSVVFLFFSYDYFFILISWESMGLFSYLLVNFYSHRVYTVKAALKTFVFARISDLFMFGSFVFSLLLFHSTDLTAVFVQLPFRVSYFLWIAGWEFQVISILAFSLSTAGAIKGAQFFSHVWLPDAMEAPTPASALIHSSTLVIAGVFLIIRFSVFFEFTTTVNTFLIIWGATTLASASVIASAQYDIKKLVAYSTISQVGYLICGCGFCCYEEVFIYLILHALNKAFLFILVGYIVHFFLGNTDMRFMGGVYSYMFDLTIFLFTTAFNLTGLPYSAGYVGKEFLLFHMTRDDLLSLWARASILISLFFTPVYMHILVFVVMFGPKRGFIGTYSTHWRGSTLLQNSTQYGYFDELLSSTWAAGVWFRGGYINNKKPLINFSLDQSWQQQTTLGTSRLMCYILLLYYSIFTYFGEIFLLTSIGLTNSVDFIQSSSFFSFKTHVFSSFNSFSTFTLTQFGFVVQGLSLFALTWLLTFNLTNSYVHLRWQFMGIFPLLLTFMVYNTYFFF